MNGISLIIPTYRSPAYLDLCLRSAVEEKALNTTEIIVIVDGFVEESRPIVDKYGDTISVLELPENKGMAYALNLGVMNASNEFVFVINDDNVLPSHYDCRLVHPDNQNLHEKLVVTVAQVEPNPSIFNFMTHDFGRTAREFDYTGWMEYEKTVADNIHTDDGRIFPFVMSKKWYMTVGGFDTMYESPFWVDCDFWTRLELTRHISFARWHGMHLYHFGSASTKNRQDAEAEAFRRSEGPAAQLFQYKWGWLPNIVEAAQTRNNSKLPDVEVIRGIRIR